MNEALPVALADLRRRVGNVISIGTIAEVDVDKAVARVTIGELKTAWLPWAMKAGEDKAWFCLDVGEQVLVFAPQGELTQGVIFAGLPKTSAALGADIWRFEFKDGSFFTFDRSSGNLTADVKGKVTINSDVEINGRITATGNIATAANITADGRITAAGEVEGSGVRLSAHTHDFNYIGMGQGATPQNGTTQRPS